MTDSKTNLLQLGFSFSQLVLFQCSCLCPQHKRTIGEALSPLSDSACKACGMSHFRKHGIAQWDMTAAANNHSKKIG